MLAPDRGTRNLLPAISEEPHEAILPAADSEGPTRSDLAHGLPASQASNHAIGSPLPNTESSFQDTGTSAQAGPLPPAHVLAAPGSATANISAPPQAHGVAIDGSGKVGDIDIPSGAASVHAPPTASAHAAPSASHDFSPQVSDSTEMDESLEVVSPESGSPGNELSPGATTPIGTPSPLGGAATGGIPLAVPDGDNLHIVQTAFVDQDAEVLLNGWAGANKIRIFAENEADMDQDLDVSLDLNGDGRMVLRLDQSMRIDQETEIDLDIYEVEGVLYVDLYLRNEVDIEQNTEIDLMMDGWSGPSFIGIDNDLDVRQHTDIDVDIEDDLEEKFAIKVAVGVKQAIDVDQVGDVDVTYADGAFGVDVDAIQTAMIDQDTTLKIDFVAV